MDDTLHITSGDSAGASLAESGVPGEVFVWHDILYDGPRSPGWPDTETLEARAAFLEETTAGGLDRQLVLETLVLPGNRKESRQPDGRYARMRNVWELPTVTMLEEWVSVAGFVDRTLVDVTATTVEEQRSTDWMPFELLAEALDPANPSLTIEGWPAPRRAIIVCHRPE